MRVGVGGRAAPLDGLALAAFLADDDGMEAIGAAVTWSECALKGVDDAAATASAPAGADCDGVAAAPVALVRVLGVAGFAGDAAAGDSCGRSKARIRSASDGSEGVFAALTAVVSSSAAEAAVGNALAGLRERANGGELAADARDTEDADRSPCRSVCVCVAGSVSATAAPMPKAAAEVDSSIRSRGSRRRNVLGAAAAAAKEGVVLRDGAVLDAVTEVSAVACTGFAGDAKRSASADCARGFDGDAAAERGAEACPARLAVVVLDAAVELPESVALGADTVDSGAANRPCRARPRSQSNSAAICGQIMGGASKKRSE